MCVVQQRPEPRERGRRDSAETRERSGTDPRFSACFFETHPEPRHARGSACMAGVGTNSISLQLNFLRIHSYFIYRVPFWHPFACLVLSFLSPL